MREKAEEEITLENKIEIAMSVCPWNTSDFCEVDGRKCSKETCAIFEFLEILDII